MPETITTPRGTVSLDNAIAKNDTSSLSSFKGICEHEREHNRNRDSYAIAAEYAVAPIATTALAGIIFKQTVPASKSLAQHTVRCAGKIVAGNYGFELNKKVTEDVVAHRRRKKEYAADQGISLENREAVVNFLTALDNNGFRTYVQQQFPDLNEAQRNVKARQIQEQYYQSPGATHPAPWDRAAAFFPVKNKKS